MENAGLGSQVVMVKIWEVLVGQGLEIHVLGAVSTPWTLSYLTPHWTPRAREDAIGILGCPRKEGLKTGS